MTISLLSRSIGPSQVIWPIWITGEFLFIPVSRSSSNAANTVNASSDTGSVTRRRKSPLGGSEIFWNVLLSFCSRIRKKNLAMQQTDQTKKQQKRIPQITTRLEQIDKVLNKLYEDNALGTIPQDRYEQMSQKYSEEYYTLKTELATLQEQLSAYENAGGRAQKFLKLTERHAAFTDLTPAILNEFINRIEVHERDQKRARYAIQHISIYFNYIGRFENEVTQLAEPTEQEIRQMREEIEEAKKEKSRAYHRAYSREYRARNLEKQREYDRMKAREYRARKKAQAAAAQPAL